MKFRRFFPFTAIEYARVFGYFAAFFAILYISIFVLSHYSSLPLPSATSDAAVMYGRFIILLIAGFTALNFASYTFLTMNAYALISGKKFRIAMWPRFMLSFVLLSLIFAVFFLFSARLASGGFAIASAIVSTIVVLAALHFFNLTYLFTSATGSAFSGIARGFRFGTAKISRLLVPYAVFIAVAVLLSAIVELSGIRILNLLFMCAFLSWAALFVCRTVMEKESGGKKKKRRPISRRR